MEFLSQYFIGGILIVFFSFGFYAIGNVTVQNYKSDSLKIVVGYLEYNFVVAVGGILIQILNLQWIYFCLYMIFVILFFSVFVFIKTKKYKIKLFPLGIKNFVKKNYFLFIVTGILMFLVLFNFVPLWYNNHLDDGYYLTKVATLPYLNEPFRTNYSTGFLDSSGIGPYTFNVHELELAFWVWLTRIDPMLFCRFFVSGLNYFLFCNVISALASSVFTILNKEYDDSLSQYTCCISILFALNEIYMKTKHIFFLQDSNQFSNAMYYGSSIVRVMGIFLLILPFLRIKKITIKTILQVGAISVVLMSKSSIALPLIVVSSLIFLCATLFFFYKKKIGVIFFVVLCLLSSLLGLNQHLQGIGNYAIKIVLTNISYLYLFIPITIIILSTLFFKNKYISRLSSFILLSLLFFSVPFLYGIASLSSVYQFVIGRAITSIIYAIILIAFIYLCALILTFFTYFKIYKKSLAFISGCSLAIFLTIFSFNSHSIAGGNLFVSEDGNMTSVNLISHLKIIFENYYFVPDSTIELGKSLNKLSNSLNEKELYVLMPRDVVVNNTVHPISVIIRSYAPEIKSVSAIYRYGAPNYTKFKNFKEEDQKVFENFMLNSPSNKNIQDFYLLLDNYPVNCVVLCEDSHTNLMKNKGFELYDNISDRSAGVEYYVYVR